MAKIYYDSDISLEPLLNKKVAVIGYGSQGRAQALNMRDSGIDVVVGVREGGKSWKMVKEDGLEPLSIEEAAKEGNVIHMLIPDVVQPEVYKSLIEPNMKPGKVLGFSHGYNIHFRQIVPPSYVDVILVAPKAPGPRMRELYLEGKGVPALFAVGQDYSGNARAIALAMAKALGCARAGVLETTFKEETETDLLGEQAVLVGGVMELIKKGYEVLVEAGYQPELAYFEACNELKLIVDLIYRGGLVGMLNAVSDTAKFGGLVVGPQIVDEHVKENMREALKRIQDGSFARLWSEDPRSRLILEKKMEEIRNHPIEKVGEVIRKLAQI